MKELRRSVGKYGRCELNLRSRQWNFDSCQNPTLKARICRVFWPIFVVFSPVFSDLSALYFEYFSGNLSPFYLFDPSLIFYLNSPLRFQSHDTIDISDTELDDSIVRDERGNVPVELHNELQIGVGGSLYGLPGAWTADRSRHAIVTTCSGSGDQQLSESQQPITTVTRPISSARIMYTSAFPAGKRGR